MCRRLFFDWLSLQEQQQDGQGSCINIWFLWTHLLITVYSQWSKIHPQKSAILGEIAPFFRAKD